MLTRNCLIAIAAPMALTACGGAADDTAMTDQAMTADAPMAGDMPMSDDMPMMSSDEAGTEASAEGTITNIDEEAGTITIDHGPVPEVEWPAMTMGFEANETQRSTVAVGDEVNFTFENSAAGATILSITKK
jgi:Cu(I)/Ag(I) efflux system protein CusF